MTPQEWAPTVGALISLAVIVGPWMFKVHAKLAVIASKCADLCDKIEQIAHDGRRLWETSSRHESRLETHQLQIAHIEQRLGQHE